MKQTLNEVRRIQKIAGILKEEEVIDLDTGGAYRGDEYIDAVGEYIDELSSYYSEFAPGPDEDEVEELLEEEGKLLFIINSEGTDPESDGPELYYSLEGNQKALDKMASILARNEDSLYTAAQVQKGSEPIFMFFRSLGSDWKHYYTLTVEDAIKVRSAAKKLEKLKDAYPETR